MSDAKVYTVSDREFVLTLELAEEGGYIATSPMAPTKAPRKSAK